MRKELDGHAGFHINPTLSLSLDFLVSPQPGLFELLEVKQEAARPLSWLYAGCLQGHVELKTSDLSVQQLFQISLKRQPAHECWIRPSCAWFAASQGKPGGLCATHTMSDPCQVWRRNTSKYYFETHKKTATSCMRWLARLCGVYFVNVLLWACGGLLPFTSIQTGSSPDHWLWPAACHSETLPELASNKPSRTWLSCTTVIACANLKLPVFSKEGHDCARGRRHQSWQHGRAATSGISISRWGARLWRRAATSAATASTQRGPMAAAAASAKLEWTRKCVLGSGGKPPESPSQRHLWLLRVSEELQQETKEEQ